MHLEALNLSCCSGFFTHTSKDPGKYERASSTKLTFPLLRKPRQLVMHQRGKKRNTKGLAYRSHPLNASALVAANCDLRSVESQRKKRLAVFVSGGGSNFRSIHEAIVKGSIHGDVVMLVTDKPGCGGAKYAADSGISIACFPKSKNSPEGLSTTELVNTLKNLDVDFVLLAGYLKLIPLELVQAFPKAILNIHPALLPAFGGKGFYGLKVHQAVIASGARYSGPTIHFVDEHYDTGRILAQRVVPVLANDTAEQLAARVLKEEHKLYPVVVAALCEERVIWREDDVPLIRDRENPNEFM